MVIRQSFIIQPEERLVWIREFRSYHSATGVQKRAETRRYFSAGARGSAAHTLIDSSRIRAPTSIILYMIEIRKKSSIEQCKELAPSDRSFRIADWRYS